MPHQLRLGLRASHDLIELGQERLRGRLVTELQIDEYLARIGEAAAHSVGLHALLGTEPFVLVEVRLPGVVVLDGVLDVNGGHVSSSDGWKTRLRRRHTPFYPRSWGFPPPYAGPVAGSQELADRASAVCRRPRSAKALREELVALVRRAVPFGGYNFPLTDPVSRVATSPLADVPGLSWPRLPALICSRYLTSSCRWDRVLEELLSADLSSLELAALMTDWMYFAGHLCVMAHFRAVQPPTVNRSQDTGTPFSAYSRPRPALA